MPSRDEALAALNQGIPTGDDLDHIILPPKAAEILREFLDPKGGIVAKGNKCDVMLQVAHKKVAFILAMHQDNGAIRHLAIPWDSDTCRQVATSMLSACNFADVIDEDGPPWETTGLGPTTMKPGVH